MALSDPGPRPPPSPSPPSSSLAFFSASQDILIDAWRIETFPERLQGTALAAYVWGYRGALITATSGVLVGLAPRLWLARRPDEHSQP